MKFVENRLFVNKRFSNKDNKNRTLIVGQNFKYRNICILGMKIIKVLENFKNNFKFV